MHQRVENMTGNELQDKIFEYRLKRDGYVSLGDLPSARQLSWLLYIDSDKDYFDYTCDDALNDILLYFTYQHNKNRKPVEYR